MNYLPTTLLSSLSIAVLVNGVAVASTTTLSDLGIHSSGLTLLNGTSLDGSGIKIGQVERFRPAQFGFDSLINANSHVIPSDISEQDGEGITMDQNLGTGHATYVAGVMISTDTVSDDADLDAPKGVAQGASLFSSATVTTAYEDALLTTQYIASISDMRAVNHSWNRALLPGSTTDGNSQLTLGMDWLASKHNVLHVFAGSQVLNFPLPTDNFNGMTIGRSSEVSGVYRRVSPGNIFDEDAVGDRTSIDLIAPGDVVEVADIGDAENDRSGTSIAAPHVTGTVALLQQYGDDLIDTGSPRWNETSPRRHEVMKAVLMNSADKIKDDGTFAPPGRLLGMDRTVVKKDGTSTWFDSDAYDDSYPEGAGVSTSLDLEMGAGHLNAKRALQQFAPGEHDADGAEVPVIGWDYHTVGEEPGDIRSYEFNEPLLGGSFISITVAWDRDVTFDMDGGMQDTYDIGDTFTPYEEINADDVINDIDLYLLRKDDFHESFSIAYSISPSNLQHLFFQIPDTGEYKFWIKQSDFDVPGIQNYAVAWWAVPARIVAQPGDFDGDSDVDGADFVVWQTNFPTQSGATLATGDADGDGDVDGADFVIWQTNFPFTPSSSVVAVPEPSGLFLAAGGLGAFAMTLRRRRRASLNVF